MSARIPFGTQLVGQLENAFGAILDRELSGSGITRHQWVTLVVAVMSGNSDVERASLAARVAGALKIGQDATNAQIDALCDSGFLATSDSAATIAVTRRGTELHASVRSAVASITETLWGDIPADDIDTAARVLNTVLGRANAELHDDSRSDET